MSVNQHTYVLIAIAEKGEAGAALSLPELSQGVSRATEMQANLSASSSTDLVRLLPRAVLLLGVLLLPACTSYGPAPPILVPDPVTPALRAKPGLSATRFYVLPARLPHNMEDIGTLFKNDGSYAQLVPENPLGPSLDDILVRTLRAGGIDAVIPKGSVPPDGATIQIRVRTFRDKMKEGLLQTTQEGKIRMEALIVLHSGEVTRTIDRTMERHRSPKPVLSFDKSDPPKLLGQLFSESIAKDLVPFLKKQIGESP